MLDLFKYIHSFLQKETKWRSSHGKKLEFQSFTKTHPFGEFWCYHLQLMLHAPWQQTSTSPCTFTRQCASATGCWPQQCCHDVWCYCWWQPEIRRFHAPVEVGSISHYLRRFWFTSQVGFLARFLNPSTVIIIPYIYKNSGRPTDP